MATVAPPESTSTPLEIGEGGRGSFARGLIDAMTVEQGDLTAVERLASTRRYVRDVY